MADDIDIEEHDVLDDPRIKNIFPDITCIKSEVMDYESKDINDFNEENYETYHKDLIPDCRKDVPSLYENKITVSSKPCESTSSEKEDEKPEILECSVVQEDWGSSLKNNPCFCPDCEVSFPTENALDSHKMTAHSFPVAVGRNKAVKSTTKSSIAEGLKFESDSNMEISNHCNHCNEVFPDEKSLLEHSHEPLTRKFICDVCDSAFESKISLQEHLKSLYSCLTYCCPICFCYFKVMSKLVSHLIFQHQVDVKDAPKPVKVTYKCRFCAKNFRTNKTYYSHVSSVHHDYFKKIVKDVNPEDIFKSCNLKFPSAHSEEIHRVSQHAIKPETISKSIDLDKQIKIEPLSPKITHRVSQHAIEPETISKSIDLDKQIKIEPLSPIITHRVSQHAIEPESISKSIDLDKQIKVEPLSPKITHRVSQHAIEPETISKSIDLDKQIKVEPLSPKITHRVSQHAIEPETISKSIDLDKQIKIEPLSPIITHRVPQHAIKTYSKSVKLNKQIKREPLSPKITQTVLKQELE